MINLILITLTAGLVVIWFLKLVTRNNNVFQKQGLKYEKPLPIIGNSAWIFTGDAVGRLTRIYSNFSKEKVIGLFEFLTPVFFLRSPELIKQLTVKDFSYFQDHVPFIAAKNDEMFGNLMFSMKGKKWRDMRSTLSPLFTGSKMRLMLDLMKNCANQMTEYLQEEFDKNGPVAYPVQSLFSKCTNDVISSCTFGVEVNSFKCPNNHFYKMAQTMTSSSWFARFITLKFFPRIAEIFNITLLPNEVKIEFNELIKCTIAQRKRENIQRPDMLQLLIKLKDGQMPKEKEMDEIDPENKMINGEFKRNWTDTELTSQCFIFYLAGFRTTANTLSFCCYQLAINPDLQDKLISEIDEAHESLDGNQLTYEALQKIKYLDMFISEVLRMWPPVISSDRECGKAYTYEDENGFKFNMNKGDILLVPIYALHMDPTYFPHPHKFDPERFNDENKPNINVHAYLPFGVGPRNCIGFRFALLTIKTVMFQLLRNFQIAACEYTQDPLKIKKSLFSLSPQEEIKLQFVPRKNEKAV